MAGRLSHPEVDLSCPICCEIFREPVVLKCSHSFCAPCLEQYWSSGRNRDCPMCRTLSVDDPVPSLTLKNLCELYGDPDLYGDPESGEMCPLHGEMLKLFCLQDQQPICVVCHTSRKHKQHDCCPVSEAVVDVKEKMKSTLGSLQEKKEAFEKMKTNYEATVTYIQAQAQIVEQRTHEEFAKLHAFLQAEEEARMEALRREEEQRRRAMERKLEEISRNITSVSESIRALEEEMKSEGVSVLHNSKKTLERAQSPISDTVMAPGSLIDMAKHLGSLSFQVWAKMQKMVKYTPVTLDPNTAAPWLLLSDDLAGVCDSDERQKLPNNPERFDPDTAVLGREGFTSGRHTWDVNVGDNTAWVVGVAKESVQKKEKVSSVLKNGYLCVYFYHKMYFAGTSPLTRLNLKRNPQKVRVQVDCEKGRVSFLDPQDNTLIYTFKEAIMEKVFPYLWVGCQRCPLTIEPQEVQLKVVQFT